MSPCEITGARPRAADDPREARRRILDIAVASTALVALAPIMALIGIAIAIESGRPVLFAQFRVGRDGRPFRMLKFRKFHRSCHRGPPLTLADDDRMTVIGRILRGTKLDELPQFWNVLAGDMSIVGPRPEAMAFADCFAGDLARILGHKPGILGPSQVIFRNECALYPLDSDPCAFYRAVLFPAKARIDIDYYERRTLAQDVGWVARAVLAILGWDRIAVRGLADVPCGARYLNTVTKDPNPPALVDTDSPQGRSSA